MKLFSNKTGPWWCLTFALAARTLAAHPNNEAAKELGKILGQ